MSSPQHVIVATSLVALAACAQGPDTRYVPPDDLPGAFTWPSTPPDDSPFEPSDELTGVRFTGRHAEYTHADCWFLCWSEDGTLYSTFSDGTVENVLADGTIERIKTLGANGADSNVGYGIVRGDDPMDLEVTGLGVLPTTAEPFASRYPSGQLFHDGVWYVGSHCEGGVAMAGTEERPWPWAGVLPLVGFRISHDGGATWTDEPNDPRDPLFDELGFEPDGTPRYGPIRLGEPWFVDFGRNMEHSPDGKAYLVAHGSTERRGDPERTTSSWCIGDQAYLMRVAPSPETINDPEAYEFFAGHDADGEPLWTSDLDESRPLVEWTGRIGSAAITYDEALGKYLFCITDGRAAHGPYDTFLLEADVLTGPWKMVAFLEDFGEQAYFVNIPSRFIEGDGRTLWLCYSANFSGNTVPLEARPEGSRYGMNLQQVRLLGPR